MQLLKLAAMLGPARARINARRVDAAVAEDRRQMLDVLLRLIKAPREQVPQVVREYLPFVNAGRAAQRFHHRPDIAAVQRPPRARHEYAAPPDAALFTVTPQTRAQRPRQEHHAAFALVMYLHLALVERLYREMYHLAHTDACGANRLHQQRQPLVFAHFCRIH